MTLFGVFSSSRRSEPAASASRAPAGPAPASAAAVSVIAVEARQLAGAWSPGERRLAVTSLAPVGRGQRVVVDVSGLGGATIALTGVVASATATAGACVAEIVLDEDRVPAVSRVLDFLRGGAVALRARAPRFRLALPAVVTWEAGHTFMNTFSVSLGGCGLTWIGAPPREGRGLLIRLGSGPRAASFKAIVCWVRGEAKGSRVGLRFLAGDEARLAAMLAETRPAP